MKTMNRLLPVWAMAVWPGLTCGGELLLATLEYPPYVMNTDYGAQGLTVDIVSAAFARMDQPISIRFFPIARGQQKLIDGEVDAFFSIKKTPERKQSMLFTERALMQQRYVFFAHKDSSWRYDGRFASVSGATIGVVNATSYGARFDAAVRDSVFSRLDVAVDHRSNFRKLLARRVDLVICSELVGRYYLAALDGSKEIGVLGPTIETTFSYLAFGRKRDYHAMARHLDEALAGMERDGTLARIYQEYGVQPAHRSMTSDERTGIVP